MSLLMIVCYGLALWLGLYLLRRNPKKPAVRYSGWGLLAYAIGLLLAGVAQSNPLLARWQTLVTVFPALCWGMAVYTLVQEQRIADMPRRPVALLVTATIFFALGLFLLILPQQLLTHEFILLLIDGDLLALGAAIAALDAYDEGAALRADMLRAFTLALAGCFVFGGQVVLIMVIEGATVGLYALLTGVITGVILLPFAAPMLLNWLDARLFSPRVQAERAELNAIAEALTKTDDGLDVTTLDDREFARLTRRALAHLGDLERLAASPLCRLPFITAYLRQQQRPDTTLERARALKHILTERIDGLKPEYATNGAANHTSDAWRYYNALYYPYVRGLKPYSQRFDAADLAAEDRAVLDWLRAQIPERTLHNWQNKAADLLAHDLREMAATNS